MVLGAEVEEVYRSHGSRHILPYIGRAFAESHQTLRVLAMGINAWTDDDEQRGEWYRGMWREAAPDSGAGFFRHVIRETDALATHLAGSKCFPGLAYDTSTVPRPGLYGTNLVKVVTGEEHRQEGTLPASLLEEGAQTWFKELDILAKHDRMPHVVVVFGSKVWDSVWKAFHSGHEAFPTYQNLKIQHYFPVEQGSPVYHNLNRVELENSVGTQTTLLVRLHHPSARHADKHDAAWLIRQPDFVSHVGL